MQLDLNMSIVISYISFIIRIIIIIRSSSSSSCSGNPPWASLVISEKTYLSMDVWNKQHLNL